MPVTVNRRQFSASLAALGAAVPATRLFGATKDQNVPKHFARFLAAFPPDGKPQPLTSRLDASLQQHAQPRLSEFWREGGVGALGDGVLQCFPPEKFAGMLGQWVMSDEARPD